VTLQSADVAAKVGRLVLSNDVTVMGTAALTNGGSGAFAGSVNLGGGARNFTVDNSGSGLAHLGDRHQWRVDQARRRHTGAVRREHL